MFQPQQRGQRIAELLRQQVSILLREVKDPGVSGLVTITDIKLAKDRKSAVLFYSVLGSAEQRASTAEALERCVPFLRRQLMETVVLRTIPKLSFEYDATPERAQRIEALLSTIEKEKKKEPDEP